ncbi:MAG: hypothetical protein ACM3MG_10590 [Bacillota bacterium]
MEIAKQHDKQNNQVLIYRRHLEDLSTLLSHYGYSIKAYRDSSMPLFQKLTAKDQENVIKTLEAYLYALRSEYLQENFSSERFVIQFLFRIGILPTDDIHETIRQEKYIQIYNSDQIQIFRSLACYERCSFTLEQMTTRTWYELWERDSFFYYACFGLAATALRFMKFTKLKLDFPYHRVTELDSTESYSFDYKIKSLSALTRQGKLQAALLVEDWKF